MNRWRWMAGAVVGVGMWCALVMPAHADTGSIDFGDPVITPVGPLSLYSYTLSIDQFEKIDTSLNPAFATLYDVNGLVPGSATYAPAAGEPTGALSVQNVGITPATQVPVDNPAIPNITVNYSGTSASTETLGVLSFLDVIRTDSADGNYSAQATLAEDNAVSANTSSVPIPTPEPATLALVLPGVAGLLAASRRRRIRA